MRPTSAIAALSIALFSSPLLAQAAPSGGDQSPVVGPTGPVYVPDPKPSAPVHGSQQTATNGDAQNSNGSHSGRHHRRGGGSGSGGGYAGVEGGPTP